MVISGDQWQSNLLEEAPHLLLAHAVDAIRGGFESRGRVVEQRGLARGDHLMRETIRVISGNQSQSVEITAEW